MIGRCLTAVATVAFAAALLGPASATAAPTSGGRATGTTASANPSAQAADGPQLTLVEQSIAVAPDGDFTAVLEVDAALATTIAVDIYGATEPGEIVGLEPEDGPDATFPPFSLTPDTGEVRTTFFTIRLYADGEDNPDPAWGWEIDEPGVYPVRVRLLDADGSRLQTLMTSIIRTPGDGQQVAQTSAALLVGVHRAPPTDPAARAVTDEADPSLFADLDPVLDALEDRPELPATFSITPDTLARVAGDQTAAADLSRLRGELESEDRTVLDAPYVDIDAASLVSTGLAESLTLQRDLGRQTLEDLLGSLTVGTWELQDRVDEATLTDLRTRGISRTLLPGDALQGGAGVLAPVDVPTGGGSTRAVSVSDAYALGLDPADDPALAAHRLLGRLAAAGTGPTGTASVVVAVDPAVVDPESLRILADALVFGSPFYRPVPLSSVFEAPVDPTTPTMAPTTPAELGMYPSTYRRSQAALGSYRSMVGGRSELVRPYEHTLALSAATDLPLDERIADAASVEDRLQEPFTSIEVPPKDKVTLGSSKGSIPLPIDSSLDYPVKVVLVLEANDRVAFPKNRIERTLQPGSTVVPVRVDTLAAGDTAVRITVRSPDDGVVLAESRYTVRSTAVSGVGLVLTGGAALFLAVWWGRHWRRTRTARPAEVPGTDEPGEPGEPGEPEPPDDARVPV